MTDAKDAIPPGLDEPVERGGIPDATRSDDPALQKIVRFGAWLRRANADATSETMMPVNSIRW